MKKVKENIASDLKTAFGKEVSNLNLLQGGGDSMIAVNDMASAIPQNEEEEIIKRKVYKSPIKKLVGNKKIDKPISKMTIMKPIMGEGETNEKWSEKYKRSIDCNNPKGFSQKAHCQGKAKKGEAKEATGAGSAGGYETGLFMEPKKLDMFKDEQPKTKVKGGFVQENKEEYCDSCDRVKSKCICNKGKKVETKEATGSASSGSYVTTAAWAKSTNKKDWKGLSKTQIPGGKFVQVKKKCKKFPYCNQGDIKALNLFENEELRQAIKNVSVKHNISENVIKNILIWEYENSRIVK